MLIGISSVSQVLVTLNVSEPGSASRGDRLIYYIIIVSSFLATDKKMPTTEEFSDQVPGGWAMLWFLAPLRAPPARAPAPAPAQAPAISYTGQACPTPPVRAGSPAIRHRPAAPAFITS